MKDESKKEISVLFVVDDPANVEQGLAKSLLLEDIVAIAANNEYDATGYIRGGQYDLVLFDITLGGDEGMKILKWLKYDERTKHIPIAIFTNNTDEKMFNQAKELGALDIVISPKSAPKQIADQIKEIFGKLQFA